MLLPRVERALEVCDEHAAAGGTNEVQVLLTQSLLILIYAEFEKKIHVLMQDRCTSVADTAMQQFAMSCFRNVFRSLKTSELSGLLGRFGESHKRMFADALDEKCRNMYDSIVHQRHAVAHGQSLNATLRDVKAYYAEGHRVLDCFREALSPRATTPAEGSR